MLQALVAGGHQFFSVFTNRSVYKCPCLRFLSLDDFSAARECIGLIDMIALSFR